MNLSLDICFDELKWICKICKLRTVDLLWYIILVSTFNVDKYFVIERFLFIFYINNRNVELFSLLKYFIKSFVKNYILNFLISTKDVLYWKIILFILEIINDVQINLI